MSVRNNLSLFKKTGSKSRSDIVSIDNHILSDFELGRHQMESVSTRHVFLSTGFRKKWSYEIPVLVNYRGFVKTQIRAFVTKKQGYRNEFYRVIVTAILIYTTSEHQHLNYRDFVKNFTGLS